MVLSDFYEQPETVIKTVEPLRYKGNELILFHVLDPQEIQPDTARSDAAGGYGNAGSDGSLARITPSTNTASGSTRTSMPCARKAKSAGHRLLPAAHRPAARRRLARIPDHPAGEDVSGFPRSLVSRRRRSRSGLPLWIHLLRQYRSTPHAVQFADVLRAAHAKLHQAPRAALPRPAVAPDCSCCFLWRWRSPTHS